MDFEEILLKKENNMELNFCELEYFFNGYLNNKIDDFLMTKMLKAICLNHLSDDETIYLTDIFLKSGDILKLDEIKNTVDKHSTGGVGDKTTLILAPIVSLFGVKMPKMSGRALGYTGGTIDKLESIGVMVNLSKDEFIKEVKEIGFAITCQTDNICPMDKKVYALRDVTKTTNEISLIASSIMSKKIASGAKNIVIDLKLGKGALVNNIIDARHLASLMIKIGKRYDRKVKCVLTKMDNPIGNNIGNKIEIMEVIDFLNNKVRNNLYDLVIALSLEIISMVSNDDKNIIKEKIDKVLEEGLAYQKFLEFVSFQKGTIDKNILDGKKIYAKKSGYIKSIDAKSLGEISMILGCGRVKKDDKIDYNAGIILNKNVGDYVLENDLLCTLYGKDIDIDIEKYFIYQKDFVSKENIIIEIIE